MPSTTIKWFKYDHLPEPLKTVAQRYAELAEWAEANLPDGAEKSVAQRKLLEAKDAAVRAKLEEPSKPGE